ncbi:MAG: response regulator transcription factor [Cyclobacteriaceae bacterium]|nr:response regulator transcription factor [Cyclobacteriaceae bacterium]
MKILVIEDDNRLAELLKRGLEDHQYIVTLVYDGEMGKKLALENSFDLVIMDLILPGINGLELCRELRKAKPDLPILILTALGTTDDKVEGFDSGADDYLVKPFDFRELHARIKSVIQRKAAYRHEQGFVLVYEDLQLNTETKIAKRAGKEISLTPKELKLLEFMLRNPNRVLSRTEIAEKVWDTHFDTGTNFIDVYINYLRKKVDKGFEHKLIHTKPGLGFVFRKSNSD